MKLEKTQREFLTEDELKSLEEVELPKINTLPVHRDMYVFAVYAGGLRISDLLLLKWSHFDGERIHMQMHKTKTVVSVKLPNKALEILYSYKKEDNTPEHYVFPILSHLEDYSHPKVLHTKLTSAITFINKNLRVIAKKAGIKKQFSFHTSRHTFATWALRKGIRIEYVSKLLGHTNIKETQVYAKIVNEELDKAMNVFN